MDLLREKMRLLPMSGPQGSGGGGGGGGSGTQTNITELPEWARPYAQDILARGKTLSEQTDMPKYKDSRYAGLSDLQKQAISSVSTPEAYNKSLQGFMDPYAQNVIDIQKREAGRQSQVAGLQEAGQAVKAGAFGGSRAGLVEAERARNTGQLMSDIQARGSEAAFQNAQQALQRDIANKMQLGSVQQADIQRPMDIAYQDFLNEQNYPYKQLGFMSDLLRGTPTGQSSTVNMYQAPGSLLGQIGGAGMGLYGMSKLFAKEGGLMESDGYAEGGVTDDRNVEGILSKLSDQQLQDARNAALMDRDQGKLQMIDAEMAERASMRSGLGSIPVDFAAFMPDEESYARGGIVAFADGDLVDTASYDPMGTGAAEIMQSASPTGRSVFEALTNEPEWKSQLRREAEDKARAAKAPPAKAEPSAKDKEIMAKYEADQKAPAAPAAPSAAAPKAPAKGLSEAARIVTDVAKTQVPKDDVKALYKEVFADMKSLETPNQKALTEALARADKRAEEIKSRGVSEALMKFGFGMAAAAAKPGVARRSGLAGALESAAAASPILAESMAENQKLQAAAEDNALKLRMEQARYDNALEQGNRQLAASLAGSISQRNLQQSTLEEQIAQNARANALKEKEIAGMAAYRAQSGQTSIQKIADDLQAADPKLGRKDALNEASKISGYSYRTEGAMGGKLAAALAKIDEDYKMLPALQAGNPNSDFVKNMEADRKRRRDEAYRLYGSEQPGGVTSGQSPAAGAGQMKLLGVR
jgi:hypothetical protein